MPRCVICKNEEPYSGYRCSHCCESVNALAEILGAALQYAVDGYDISKSELIRSGFLPEKKQPNWVLRARAALAKYEAQKIKR